MGTTPRVAALLPGDGSRREILSDVYVDAMRESPRLERFQAAGSVVGYLDDDSVLRVVHVDEPDGVAEIPEVGSFALGPDGQWWVTREGTAGGELFEISIRGEVTFRVRGDDETVALGESHILVGNVHPAGWVRLDREFEPSEYFDAAARALVLAPAETLDGPFRDDGGGVYADTGSAIVRWDPFAQMLEEIAPSPGDARVPVSHALWGAARPVREVMVETTGSRRARRPGGVSRASTARAGR